MTSIINPDARLAEVQARAAEIEPLMAAIEAVEAPTDEQRAEYTELDTEITSLGEEATELKAQIAKREKTRESFSNPAMRENGFGAGVNVTIKKDPFENLEAVRFADPDSEDLVARAVTAVSEVKMRGVNDKAREEAVRTIEQIPGAAAHALVHGSPAYRSAFEQWGKSQGNPQYTREESDAVRAALNITTGASGQFMLPTLFDPTLIKTGTAVKDPIRALARVETITQNIWNGVSVGNVTTAWTAEATAATEGSPTYAHPTVTVAKLLAWVTGSYEIFEDSPSINQLPALIAEAMSFAEQTAFISGSGSGAPKGIVTAISATAASTVTATTRGSFTSASSVDVYAVVNAVTPRYEDSATWVANKSWFNIVNTMAPQGGGSLYWRDLSAPVTTRPPLLGSPTAPSSDMSSATTSGTVIAVLGDFSQYLIVDRIGMALEYVPQVFNSSGVPLGQRGLIAHKRVGADCLDINAFRFLKA